MQLTLEWDSPQRLIDFVWSSKITLQCLAIWPLVALWASGLADRLYISRKGEQLLSGYKKIAEKVNK